MGLPRPQYALWPSQVPRPADRTTFAVRSAPHSWGGNLASAPSGWAPPGKCAICE